MAWHTLSALEQLDAVDADPEGRTFLLFKHSTRCSISKAALGRLQRSWQDGDGEVFLLDLLRHRDVSNAIADRYGVRHASPQVLVVRGGRCLWSASHLAITYPRCLEALRL